MPIKISRILHAGYVVECDGKQIAFDPVFENPFSKNCYAFPDVRFDTAQIRDLKFAAVFISHFHDDHCSFESLRLLDRQTPIYIYCLFEELFSWIRELGFEHVHALRLNVPIWVGSIEIIPRRALDAGVDSMFQIKAEGLNILNVVDSWIDEDTLERLIYEGPWDLVLWPFQTMREVEVIAPSHCTVAPGCLPEEWIAQLKKLKPRYVVPSSCQFIHESWSWYNQAFFPISYRQFQKEVESALPSAKFIRMNPSISVVLSQNSLTEAEPLSWVKPVGPQDVDYEYRPEIEPPPTSEIAKNFAPLAKEQIERVYEYCRQELPKKYSSLEPSEELFFSRPRLWRLAIFDHQGLAHNFFYRIAESRIEWVPVAEEFPAWTTEVPISRLYGALEFGETLTSMYLRVENETAQVDIFGDPLIRCLFDGVFGAYQKAQLKRIRESEMA